MQQNWFEMTEVENQFFDFKLIALLAVADFFLAESNYVNPY
jgi:hypothetical protein